MLLGKDIRLGNYVIDRDGNNLRIDCIGYLRDGYDTKITEIIHCDNDTTTISEYTSFAKGAILDKKWLQNLGFIELQSGNWTIELFRLELDYNTNMIVYNTSAYTYVKLEFVHQLQNLFYVITGNELTIIP